MRVRPAVLVVDRDPVASSTIASVLARGGMDVVAVEDGRAAAAALVGQRFDVVLLDIETLDWSSTLQSLFSADPRAEIVVATANADDALKALRAGASDAVGKPYLFDELRLRIARAAERRTLRALVATYDASQDLLQARGRDELLAKLPEVAARLLGADEVGVLLRDGLGSPFEILKATSYPEAVLRWLADLAAVDGRGRIWPSASDRPIGGAMVSLTCSLVLPLVTGGDVFGVFVVLRRPGSPAFTTSELEQGLVLASQVALSFGHARVNGALEERLADIDSTRERVVHIEKLGLAGDLAASVAHEVNNPLTFVGMNLAELRAMDFKTASVDEIYMLIDETTSGVTRIAELVSGFGRLATPSPTKPPRRIEPVAILQAAAAQHPATVRCNTLEPLTAFTDADTLQSALEAIFRFLETASGPRTKPVVVDVTRIEGQPAIAITDDALVLSDNERLRLFDPRVGVDTRAGRTMRLDLDLALAYQALRANGVDVAVTGNDVMGVKIALLLPALPDRLALAHEGARRVG